MRWEGTRRHSIWAGVSAAPGGPRRHSRQRKPWYKIPALLGPRGGGCSCFRTVPSGCWRIPARQKGGVVSALVKGPCVPGHGTAAPQTAGNHCHRRKVSPVLLLEVVITVKQRSQYLFLRETSTPSSHPAFSPSVLPQEDSLMAPGFSRNFSVINFLW